MRYLNSASHVVTLVKAFDQSEGDVLELGVGFYSTPLLHWLSAISRRLVVSYETQKKWADRCQIYSNEKHEIHFEPDFDKANFTDRHWGMVFVDHEPAARRIVDILRLKDNADFIVVHDTEPEVEHDYHYLDVFKQFKYVYQDTKYFPNTTVLSNFKQYQP